ncbi:MAG: DUF1697 domain-containing protein [Chloroflexota bacterium]
MEDLRTLYGSIGLAGTKTLLQSGNAVFISEETDPAALEARIATAIETEFGFHSDIFIRTLDEWREIITGHPFGVPEDVKKLLFIFLAAEPADDAITAVQEAMKGPEQMTFSGRHIYIYYPEGMGRSKLDSAFLDRHLKISGTGRNWNTAHKILILAERFEN